MLFVIRRTPLGACALVRLVALALFSLLCCPLVQAQSASIALIQHASKDAGTTSSSSLAFSAANTVGNWIAVVVRAGGSGQVFTVADARGNTYREATRFNVTVDAPLGSTLAIFYAENIRAGANTITVSATPGSSSLRFAILEYSGVALTGSLQGAAAAQGTNAAPSSGSTPPTASGNLVLGAVMTADARTFTAGSGFAIRDRVPAAPATKLIVEDRIQPAAGAASANATLNTSNPWGAVVAAFRTASTSPQPDLIVTKTHSGAFVQGQSGATYTLIVSNTGSASSVGTVTVTDTLPIGLTATGISGSGWNCTLAALSCTRGDALAAGASYPPITLTVSVAGNAPASVTNTASVAGGGELNTGNNAASDLTPIGSGTDTQLPTAPGGLTATASGNQINLNWTASTDNIGVTNYRVEQCSGAGCTNFTEIAQAAAALASVGPLTASANPNYFKDTSGTPVILNGSHTWNNLQDWGTNGSLRTLDFDAYVNFLVAHGHNFTLLWYVELPKFCNLPTTAASPPNFTVGPHPWQRTGPGNATDGAPKFDLTKFNQAYFDRLRARVQALNTAGIYVGVYTFTAEWLYRYRCSSDGYPFTSANNINGISDGGGTSTSSFTMSSPNAITAIQDAYVEKVIDTLNDLPNVLWMVSEEAPPNSEWWNEHQISHIRSYESGKPYRHPIGYGVPAELSDAVLFSSDADWIAGDSNIAPTTSCGSGSPACKVNVNDSDHSYFGMWNDSAQTNRSYAWRNFTNGNQVLFMDPYMVYYPREGRNLCLSPTNGICAGPDPRWDNFRNNLGYILRYSRKLNLANVTPRAALCSTSHCLAQTPAVGAEYLIYSPNGGTFTVNLSAMSSTRTLNVEWFNPATGATTVASPIAAGSSARSFTPPFSGDAVLYLVDAAGHAGTAPLSTSYNVTGLTAGVYRYRVRAADAAGNLGLYSTVAGATIQAPDTAPPTAPSGMVATTPGSGQISLSWTAATDNVGVTGYLVERCQGPGCATFTQVAATTGAGTTFGDTGLAPSTSYTYRVRATDAANNAGPYSNTTTATTLPGPTGITLVQHASKDAGAVASSALAFTSGNLAGNWIAVAIRSAPSTQPLTVTDTRGNTYRKAIQLNETIDGMAVAIFYAESIAGGANTVTVSKSLTGGSLRFAIFEYAGVALTSSLDRTAAAQGTSATPNSGTVTSTSSGDLVIGVLATANGRTYAGGSGYLIEERVPAAPNTKLIVVDRTQAAAGPLSAGATLNTSDNWGAIVAAFRPASTNAQPQANLSVTPSSLIFSSRPISSTSAPQIVTLANVGGASLAINSIGVAGAHSADFVQGNSCGTALPAGTSCFISVTFTPHATGARVATLTISDNAPGSPHTVALAGTGTAALAVSPRVTVLTANQTQQFAASVSGAIWSVDGVTGGTAASGTITAAGLYTAPSSAGTHTVTATTADQLQSGNSTIHVSAYTGTFTHHNDKARTGQNLNETVLTPANVAAGTFGKLFSYQLDGVAHASPLYVAGVTIPGQGVRNVVYVATEHNSVYAFDADGRTSTPLWKVSFINPGAGITAVPAGDTGECCDIAPEIGITGTPVIDPASATLYVVSKTKEVSGSTTRHVQRLHALDITTGAEKFAGPMQIQASVPGTGMGSQGGQLVFDALRQNQRAALLLSNGVVHIAFGSHGDHQPYHGWLLGYQASTLQQLSALCTTPNGEGGGIWMSNGGPAADASGSIYFSTGDGTFAPSTRSYGDSLVKVNPGGTVQDYFTPSNQSTLDARDTDFGAGGILLLPDQPGAHPHLAITAGKNAAIHLIDRDNMGQFNAAGDSQIVQSLPNIFPLGTPDPGNYSAPVYFNGTVYFSPVADAVKAFQLSNGMLSSFPTSQSSARFAYRGGSLAVSANASADGILWAVEHPSSTTPGVLHAYDPSSLAIELYNSNQAGTRDTLGVAGKFSAPLIANGKVFIGAASQLIVYGLLP